jgi:hypothetical protein
MKEQKYDAVCVKNEDSISALLNEELDIDSDDQMQSENERKTVSEESSYKISESESDSGISVVLTDGWEEVTMCDMKPKTYTFTKNAGP